MPDTQLLIKFATDNIFLIAVALVSGGMLIWPALRGGAGGQAVTVQQATLMINRQDAQVLDIREQAEYEKAHILNARNLPLSQLEARAGNMEKLKKKPVIVACEHGNRSASAAASLRKHGFEQVFCLAGGLAGWQQAGLPVEK